MGPSERSDLGGALSLDVRLGRFVTFHYRRDSPAAHSHPMCNVTPSWIRLGNSGGVFS
jgi:hypothetical protein